MNLGTNTQTTPAALDDLADKSKAKAGALATLLPAHLRLVERG